MISSNIPLYVVLRQQDSSGRTMRLFPIIAWEERESSLVAVIPTNVDEDDYKKAYPVDDPLVISEYGYILEYVLPEYLKDCIEKWENWTIDGDGDRLFFVFGRDF